MLASYKQRRVPASMAHYNPTGHLRSTCLDKDVSHGGAL
jgi:hypothetical protein